MTQTKEFQPVEDTHDQYMNEALRKLLKLGKVKYCMWHHTLVCLNMYLHNAICFVENVIL